MGVSTWAARLAILGDAIATGKRLDPAATWVGLIAAPFTAVPNMVIDDITEASYASYARLPVTAWSAPFVDVDGQAKVDGGDKLWVLSGGDDPVTVYGWGLFSALTVGTLLYAAELPEPIPLADTVHGALIDVEYIYGE